MTRLFFGIYIFLLAISLNADEEAFGLHCGTRGNLWGTIASDLLIPDYFPPENELLRALLIDSPLINLGICEDAFTPAYLGQSCMMHDQCYQTLGATKDGCDEDLKGGWLESCDESYPGFLGFFCRSACKLAVRVMYTALRFQSGEFCPSCRAFEEAQKNASSNHLAL